MSIFINPWELGSDLNPTGSSTSIPNFCEAKYMVVRMAPPKGKGTKDGLVMTAIMLSYTVQGVETKVTEVTEGTSGYEISFPLGKRGILATKYRGPKSMYKFINPETKKFYQISNDKFTETYAKGFMKQSIQDWDSLSAAEQDTYVDEYFENMYTFAMANDFAIDTSKKDYTAPKPGMVTSFYRQYTPPAEGEKYGNVIISKWPSKTNPDNVGKVALSGDFKMYDETIAMAIYDKLVERENDKFDPTSFVEDDQ